MKITKCEMNGLLLVQPDVFGDSRGYFMESWNSYRYCAGGLCHDFFQDNVSSSKRGTLRGLHYQLSPHAQGKLVSVLQGEVFDVAVDIRRSSPTFGCWHGVILPSEHNWQFYIPPGFAHGFMVTSETALFHYKCTDYYAPECERTIRYDDPNLGINWPDNCPLFISERDANAPYLKDIPKEALFN